MLIPAWRLWAAGLAALAITAVVAGFYTYVTHLQESNAALTADLAVESQARALLEGEIHGLRLGIEAAERHRAALQDDLARARAQADEALRTLKEHDLARLAAAKPGLVSRAMNRGTAKVFRDIEDASKE
jgi:hypothetical protein